MDFPCFKLQLQVIFNRYDFVEIDFVEIPRMGIVDFVLLYSRIMEQIVLKIIGHEKLLRLS